MKWKFAAGIVMAIIAGIGVGQLVCDSIACRGAIGLRCGRGHLVALVQNRGIYQADVERACVEFRYRSGQDELGSTETAQLKKLVFSRLTLTAAAELAATDAKVEAKAVERELTLLQSQFRDRNAWTTALHANRLSERSLRRMFKDNLRARRWVSRQIASQLEVTMEERQQFYQQHSERYSLSVRFRASHLFLAAPSETPPEIVDLKEKKIGLLAKRIKAGESFSELVATESEDEASKTHGGDLGYFSAYRMPPDFFRAAAKLRPGEMSAPVRASLGFHIIQMTDLKPARQMTFEEVSQEIGATRAQEKRQAALGRVDVDLSGRVRVVDQLFQGQL